jgi:hypothetical protein
MKSVRNFPQYIQLMPEYFVINYDVCSQLLTYSVIYELYSKTNEELETLIKKENIVRFIKSQRLRWAALPLSFPQTYLF